jgi:phosphoribosylformylglycinamidine synthase
MVGINTLVRPGQADAAVLRIKGAGVAIAATTDVNARACYLDPREGARASVAEAARNLACVGAKPLGMTDGLNFANPEDPEVYWQFVEVVEGIREAGLALGIPVTGGNVSFYNQTGKSKVFPTPVIGMLGVLEDSTRWATTAFGEDGEAVYLLGGLSDELGGSEYMMKVHGKLAGPLPRVDFTRETSLGDMLRASIAVGLVRTAHDISSGGLVSALAEACLAGGRPHGVAVELGSARSAVAALFSEAPGRAIVAVDPRRDRELTDLCAKHGLPLSRLGTVGGGALVVAGHLEIALDELAYLSGRSFLDRSAAGAGGVA